MDDIDEKIIEALKQNGRATASEISRRVSLSIPATAERIRKLEQTGTVEQYTVRLNRQKLGYRLLAMVFLNVDRTEEIETFRKTVVTFAEVIECHHMAGEYDYLLKVLCQDTAALETFLSKKLKAIRGVAKTNTIIVLSSLKETMNR
jgi:Lrp/AsnC family transcriptional regulator, leucine-responsive regulatory protein